MNREKYRIRQGSLVGSLNTPKITPSLFQRCGRRSDSGLGEATNLKCIMECGSKTAQMHHALKVRNDSLLPQECFSSALVMSMHHFFFFSWDF